MPDPGAAGPAALPACPSPAVSRVQGPRTGGRCRQPPLHRVLPGGSRPHVVLQGPWSSPLLGAPEVTVTLLRLHWGTHSAREEGRAPEACTPTAKEPGTGDGGRGGVPSTWQSQPKRRAHGSPLAPACRYLVMVSPWEGRWVHLSPPLRGHTGVREASSHHLDPVWDCLLAPSPGPRPWSSGG